MGALSLARGTVCQKIGRIPISFFLSLYSYYLDLEVEIFISCVAKRRTQKSWVSNQKTRKRQWLLEGGMCQGADGEKETQESNLSCVCNPRLTPDVYPESHNIKNGQDIVKNYTKYKNQKNVNNS